MRTSSSAIGVAITSAVSVVALYLLHIRNDGCPPDTQENLNKGASSKSIISGESKEDDTELMSTSSNEPEPLKDVSLQGVNSFLVCRDSSGAAPTSIVTHPSASVIHPFINRHDTGESVNGVSATSKQLPIPRSSSLSSLLLKSSSLPSRNPSLNSTANRRTSDVQVVSVYKKTYTEQSEGFIISLEDLVMCNELRLQREDEDKLFGMYDYGDDFVTDPSVRHRPRRHSDVGLPIGDC